MNQPTTNLFTDGSAYERMMGRWSRKAGTLFLDWLGAASDLDWLDAGCGNGAFTEEIVASARPRSITGVDPSPQQLDYARSRPNLGSVRLELGDAQNLPFQQASFDASVMALVIAFIPDPARAVAELCRVTRPGGIVATYMWDLPGGGVPHRPVHRALASMGYASPLPPQSEISRRDALERLWAAAGLQEIAATVLHITVHFDGFADFWDFNSAPTGPQGKFIGSLSAEKREELRQRLQAELPTAADGSISYGAFANAVKGRVPRG